MTPRPNVRKIRLDPFERGLIEEPIVEPSPYRGLIWALLLLACVLFTETRQARPPVYLGDEWQTWLASIGQILSAFHTPERRWAAITLVANDLVLAMPGLPLAYAFHHIAHAVKE